MSDEFLMKGKVYAEHKHKLVYPVVAEVKYDEIRLHVRRVGGDEDGAGSGHIEFLSYAGKPLHNLNHWAQQFWDFMLEQGVRNLDLGVCVNGNFNDSYRWTRSSTGIPKEKLDKKTGKIAPALDVSMVQFYLFDWPDSTQPFKQRRFMLDKAASYMRMHGIPTNRPESWVVESEAELDALFVAVREFDHEGLMVKALGHTYQIGKRIDGWLKMKPEMDCDGIITAVNQAVSIEGVPLPRAGSIDVLLEDGSVASPSGINWALGALMFLHPEDYIGQHVEFVCMERDRKGGYRHPVFKRLREAKK
jgi:hypothetical protein